jgi:hypothetical protein
VIAKEKFFNFRIREKGLTPSAPRFLRSEADWIMESSGNSLMATSRPTDRFRKFNGLFLLTESKVNIAQEFLLSRKKSEISEKVKKLALRGEKPPFSETSINRRTFWNIGFLF